MRKLWFALAETENYGKFDKYLYKKGIILKPIRLFIVNILKIANSISLIKSYQEVQIYFENSISTYISTHFTTKSTTKHSETTRQTLLSNYKAGP